MIYIVCWIHVLYWLNIPLLNKSYFLVEMPIIFFIAGASSRLAKPKTEKEIILNRFKRVFVPYYKYAIISIILFGLYGIFSNKIIPAISIKQLFEIILGLDIPCVPLAYHIWFILPYFIISIIPKKFESKLLGGTIIAIAFLDLLNSFYPNLSTDLRGGYMIVKEILAYNLFYICGYLFYHQLSKRKITIIFIFCVLLFMCISPFYPYDMQINKFPPNLFFIAYNGATLSFLGLVFSYLHMPKIKILDKWNRNGYGIYIYQNYYFCAWIVITHFFAPLNAYLYLIISCIAIFTMGCAAEKIFSINMFKKILL